MKWIPIPFDRRLRLICFIGGLLFNWHRLLSQNIDSIGIANVQLPAAVSNSMILKIGYVKNDVDGGFYDVAIERLIRRHVAVELDFGCFPYNRGIRTNYGSYLGYHVGLEGRYYFALRKLPLDGFHIGPYAAFNEIIWYYSNVHRKESLIYWPQLGFTLGFQKCFFKHFVIGGGIKGGYCGSLTAKFYWPDGRYAGGFSFDQKTSFFYQLMIGYKF